MFTGLIETVGTVVSFDRRGAGAQIRFGAGWPDNDIPAAGDSIAVNGACLTAIDPAPDAFSADLSPETLDRTLLADLRAGDRVNLERALRLGDRMGGHIVQGHVDGPTRIISIRPESGFQRWRLSVPSDVAGEVAPKGSVAVNGVSLTVAAKGHDWFEIALIPATLEATTLGGMTAGARLHLETDVLAKYVAQRLDAPGPSSLETIFGGGGDA